MELAQQMATQSLQTLLIIMLTPLMMLVLWMKMSGRKSVRKIVVRTHEKR